MSCLLYQALRLKEDGHSCPSFSSYCIEGGISGDLMLFRRSFGRLARDIWPQTSLPSARYRIAESGGVFILSEPTGHPTG